MRYFSFSFILCVALILTGCPKSTTGSIPTPPPITQPPIVTPPPVITPPVVVPPSPTVFSFTDIQAGMAKTCGTCGDSGGSSNPASAVYHQTLNVADAPAPNSGKAAMFDLAGDVPYANAYWYWAHTFPVGLTKIDFTYDFYLYIPAESLAASQAIEWEMQESLNNTTYNFALQLQWRNKILRTFDYTNKGWKETTVPTSDFTPDTWHHVVVHNVMDSVTKTGTIKSLTVDYKLHDLNITRPGTAKASRDHLTNAFQLDSNGKTPPTPYKVYVDKMRLTYYELTN